MLRNALKSSASQNRTWAFWRKLFFPNFIFCSQDEVSRMTDDSKPTNFGHAIYFPLHLNFFSLNIYIFFFFLSYITVFLLFYSHRFLFFIFCFVFFLVLLIKYLKSKILFIYLKSKIYTAKKQTFCFHSYVTYVYFLLLPERISLFLFFNFSHIH